MSAGCPTALFPPATGVCRADIRRKSRSSASLVNRVCGLALRGSLPFFPSSRAWGIFYLSGPGRVREVVIYRASFGTMISGALTMLFSGITAHPDKRIDHGISADNSSGAEHGIAAYFHKIADECTDFPHPRFHPFAFRMDDDVPAVAFDIGGNGTGTRHLTKSAGQALKRTGNAISHISRSGLRGTAKEVFKAGRYYYSQIATQAIRSGRNAIVPIITSNIPNAAYNLWGAIRA